MRLLKLTFFELKNQLQDLKLLLAIPLLPLLILIALLPVTSYFQQASASSTPFTVAIVDECETIYTRVVLSHIKNSISVQNNINLHITERASAEDMLTNDKAALAVIITEDYITEMQNGTPIPIEVIIGSSHPFQSSLFLQSFESGIRSMETVQNELYVILHFLRGSNIPEPVVSETFNSAMIELGMSVLGRDNLYNVNYVSPWGHMPLPIYYSCSVLLAFLSFLGLYHYAKRNRQERQLLYQRASLAEMQAKNLASADIFATAIILFIQSSIIYAAVLILRNFLVPEKPLTLSDIRAILLLIPVSLTIVLFAALLSLLCRSDTIAAIIFGSLSILMLLCSGLIIPTAFWGQLPNSIKFISPYYYWGELFLSIISGSDIEILHCLITLLLPCILFFTVRRVTENAHILSD